MLNNVVLMGRMVSNPDYRTTTSGKSVCSFRLAVDRPGKEKQADFIQCVAWQGTADFVSRYFFKGSMVAVIGSIQTRNYEDKNGQKRTAVDVVVREVSFTGERAQKQAEIAPTVDFKEADNSDFEEIESGDLPF